MAGKSDDGSPSGDVPFWQRPLRDLTPRQWEALCDGCGRCCLNKLEDWDTGEIYFTDVACTLLDADTCRCSDYANRFARVPDCVLLTREKVQEVSWLPPTCAYRLRRDGKPLRWWHHLLSGDPNTVHTAGISARGRTVSEEDWSEDEYEERIVDWVSADPEKSP